MCVRIDKSGENNAPTGIHNLRVACVVRDLRARTDYVDLSVADQHSAIANDCRLGHLCADARPFRARKRDQLRSVKNSQRLHDLLSLLSTMPVMVLNCASDADLIFRTLS